MASFYILLVSILVGSNLARSKKRKNSYKDKKYVVQFKEGEKVKCTVEDGKGHTEQEDMLYEDV